MYVPPTNTDGIDDPMHGMLYPTLQKLIMLRISTVALTCDDFLYIVGAAGELCKKVYQVLCRPKVDQTSNTHSPQGTAAFLWYKTSLLLRFQNMVMNIHIHKGGSSNGVCDRLCKACACVCVVPLGNFLLACTELETRLT